jgi:dienelactone hydrolase
MNSISAKQRFWFRISLAAAFLAMAFFNSIVTAQGPVKQKISGQPFTANLHIPQGKGPFPGIIVVGGSGGGIEWQDYWGEVLAQNGFAALALAYFGMEGLPAELNEIPLEYFQGALNFFRSCEAVDGGSMGMLGVSKGSELALLFSSREPVIHAVAAFVPSSVVFQSIAKGWPRTSSWSHKGKPLPFVPYSASDSADKSLADLYRRSLEHPEAVEKAAIEVEKIKGPLLLLSGKDDQLWPSSRMSEMIMERLAKHNFPFSYEHIPYDAAGHLISQRRDDATKRGGTKEGNRFAQEDGQRRILAFFSRCFKRDQ